jgi:O-antigen ligase
MNFGLEGLLPTLLYASFWAVVAISICSRPMVGICYLVLVIPAQSIRDRMVEFPLGSNLITLGLLAVALGLLRERKSASTRGSGWMMPLSLYAGYTLFSTLLGSSSINHPLFDSPRLAQWRNYLTMMFMLLLVAAAVKTTRDIKLIVLIMCIGVFFVNRGLWATVSDRDFSAYSADLQEAGAMGNAGVNGLAAFEAQMSMFLLAIGVVQKERIRRWACLGLGVFSVLCLMYTLSRGGYAGFLVGCVFLGVVRYRLLLVLLAIFAVTWASVVPNAVVERVDMTYDSSGELDNSSELRVSLWDEAMAVFESNPITGTGFDTYQYGDHVNGYKDTHNVYVKILVETGLIGLALVAWLTLKSFWSGWKLFRMAKDPFHAALGLGLASWVVACIVTNFFGDRWTIFQVNGYMWVIGGLVLRAWVLEREAENPVPANAGLETAGELAGAVA